MKLGAVGVATIVLGAVIGSLGLVAIGAWWVVMGLVVRQHARGLAAVQAETGAPDLDGLTFARGTLLWAALGLPSLAVGVLALGIDPDDLAWRWLPVAVGGLALGVGALSALLYVTGSAALAVADRVPERTVPATVWVTSMEETGTSVNDRPRLRLGLRVEPDHDTGVAAYDVVKKATVPLTALGSLRVGGGFRATVAGPDHPTSMEVHWDHPVGRPTAVDGGDAAARLDALDRLRQTGRITEEEYRAQRARILESL